MKKLESILINEAKGKDYDFGKSIRNLNKKL